ncbi:MAG: carbonic anhydrase [Cloacibacterium sp.]|jgi:carbonic anhydrase|nr:carbonic anhydrase [Cloacibacterium sp.]
MKKVFLKSALILTSILALTSCEKKTKTDHPKAKLTKQLSTEKTKVINDSVSITEVEHYMTKEQQEKHTPDMVLKELEAGNERFMNGNLTARDHSKARAKVADHQYPKAFVLSCMDSRVPVEDVFDQGIGDLFVGRVAGNIANKDILGSMEYACKVAGTKVIVVLGHANCGAIKGAIDNVKLGNLTNVLDQIKPAINMTSFAGPKTSDNYDYKHQVSLNNVKNTIKNIREKSPILKEMEDKGQIKIIGAFYSLTNGHMEYVQK